MWQPSVGYRKLVKHIDNGEPHFLTFTCYRGIPLLSKDRTRRWFIEALEGARQHHGFDLWAWVIMPEHVHLLIAPPLARIDPRPSSNIGKIQGILADIKRPIGRKAIRHLKKNAPEFLDRLTVRNRGRTYRRFWQAGSGHDENIDDETVLYDVAEYIHANPVRRGLVQRAEDWPWSSAADWYGASTQSAFAVDRTMPSGLEIPWQRVRS